MTISRAIPLLLLLGWAFVDTSQAAALFRCGGGIVSESDSIERVAELCGGPDEQSSRTVVRHSPGYWRDDRWVEGRTRVVHIEEWIFDFGPRRLVQALTFHNGSLVDIRSQGFGTGRRLDARERTREWVIVPRARLQRREG